MATAVPFARWDPRFLDSITLQERLCHTCLYIQDVQWNLLVSAHAMWSPVSWSAWLVSQLFKSLVLSLSPQLPWLRRKTTSGQHGAAHLVFFFLCKIQIWFIKKKKKKKILFHFISAAALKPSLVHCHDCHLVFIMSLWGGLPPSSESFRSADTKSQSLLIG